MQRFKVLQRLLGVRQDAGHCSDAEDDILLSSSEESTANGRAGYHT
ncbi:hypothetical protein SM0020_20409 [Sinorhizobium meliloti CCNWSX0020]|uniref:Uncharacterized protein n=1 Tax=Sinorhizobium meliloti CCNWSX0020 TaxID=1107881 RepID=H0G3N3_RHIML|nr:hypothetical protein SM0020_20409 [Sinorhizobium meliloti CCNWSX0020]